MPVRSPSKVVCPRRCKNASFSEKAAQFCTQNALGGLSKDIHVGDCGGFVGRISENESFRTETLGRKAASSPRWSVHIELFRPLSGSLYNTASLTASSFYRKNFTMLKHAEISCDTDTPS
jgi:hypothetical protein